MDYTKQKCLVCGDKASGLHYTVISCESCKSFFGRKIKSKAKFTCEANGNCVMDLYTRRHCPACRLKKCLDVGMKPESEFWCSNFFYFPAEFQKMHKSNTWWLSTSATCTCMSISFCVPFRYGSQIHPFFFFFLHFKTKTESDCQDDWKNKKLYSHRG